MNENHLIFIGSFNANRSSVRTADHSTAHALCKKKKQTEKVKTRVQFAFVYAMESNETMYVGIQHLQINIHTIHSSETKNKLVATILLRQY